MKLEALPARGVSFRGCAACVGEFGSLHEGHARIVAETVRIARKTGLPAAVLMLLDEDALLPLDMRAAKLEEMGVDYVGTLALDDAMRRRQGGGFFDDILMARLRARHLVVCRTMRLGRGRLTDVEALRTLCGETGVTLTVLAPSRLPGGEDISDALIARALNAGDLSSAALMLGREPEPIMVQRALRWSDA